MEHNDLSGETISAWQRFNDQLGVESILFELELVSEDYNADALEMLRTLPPLYGL